MGPAGQDAAITAIQIHKVTAPKEYKIGETIVFDLCVHNSGANSVQINSVEHTLENGTSLEVSGAPITLTAGQTNCSNFSSSYNILESDLTATDDPNVCILNATVKATGQDNNGNVVTAIDPCMYCITKNTDAGCNEGPITIQCTTPASAIVTSFTQTPPNDLVTTELSRGQLGDGIFGAAVSGIPDTALNDALDANNRLNIAVPPHSKDCKLWFHLTGGEMVRTGLPTSIGAINGANIEPVLVSDMSGASTAPAGATPDNSDIFSYVYCMDGTGDAVGDISIEFANINNDDPGDHVMWVWSETCSASRPLYAADIDIPNVVEFTGQDTSAPAPNTQFFEDSFTTNCPALVFGAGRHVKHPSINEAQSTGAVLQDSTWFNTSLGGTSQEIYDIVGNDSYECQSGLGMDFLPDPGTYTWDWHSNAFTGAEAGWQDQVMTVVLPFSCNGFTRSEDLIVEGCQQTITSDLCNSPATTTCSANANFNYSLVNGGVLYITPVINGFKDISQQVIVDTNGNGTTPVPVTINGTVNEGETVSCQIGYEAYIDGGAGSTVQSLDYVTTFTAQ
jgi:hypothetical protein